jgi:DNA/RNA-binding domain of Phe-tRNA-synthetase-like protein
LRSPDLCTGIEDFVHIDEEVKTFGIHIAFTVSWAEESVPISGYPFEDDVNRLVEFVKSNFTLENLKNHRVVRAYRDFFWRLGIDPTKTRPASEALVRRALRNQFPRINTVVDAGNIASVHTFIPIGIYDLDKALLPLRIKLSRGSEVFKPIGGREEVLGKGVPILVDSKGTVMHIYPHRDSVETCVTDSTKRIITIAAGVPGVEKELVVKAVQIVVELLKKVGWRSCTEIVYKY